MVGGDWVGMGIAAMALAVSVVSAFLTWRWRMQDTRKADVSVYFHRTRDYAKVHLPDGTVLPAGYHLVLWNRGPAVARNVTIDVLAGSARQLVQLLDVEPDEFPLNVLDSGARYPIPWLLRDKKAQDERRFLCRIEWSDDAGARRANVPLRRGETSV